MLCDACRIIFKGRFESTEPKDGYNISWRDHHLTEEEFEDSVLKSCPICMIVCERLRGGLDTLEEKHQAISTFTVRLQSTKAESPPAVVSKKIDSTDGSKGKAFSTYAFKPRSIGLSGYDGLWIEIGMINVLFNLIPQKEMINCDSLLSSPSLDWPLDLGKRWLQDCIANHQCQKANSSPWMPTRLLELNKPEVGSLSLIHTKDTDSGTEAKIPYITLSHCWGGIELQKLERGTSNKLSTGIPVSSLHKTFQDVVKVALFLGVNHIWVDCLCIYQDSADDWAHESSLMGKIYEHGVCNISASAAKDANGGLFQNRSFAMLQDCYIESRWEDRPNHQWRVVAANFPSKWLLDGPALYRAWVVQERILAPRVLHFGKRQLYWECQDFDACETYTHGVPKFVSGESNRPNPFKTKGFHTSISISTKSQQQASKQILRSWREIVNVYTDCQLTVSADKLVAISGLAKSVQSSLSGAEYLAGLWKISFLRDLSWGTYLQRGTRPEIYRAPSWSWATIDGPILDWGHRGKDREFGSELEVAFIKDISIQHRTSDQTGQVDSGLLRIQGHLMTLGVYDNVTGQGSPTSKIHGVQANRLRGARIDVDIRGENIHILPLTWLNSKRQLLDCLLLQPTGVKQGEFRRYGRLELDCTVYKIDSLDCVINESWMEFEDDLGGGRYTISIV